MSALATAGCISSGTAAQPVGHWLAGDTHVHSDHSSDGSLPRQSSDQRLPGNLPVRDQIAEAGRNRLDFLALTDHRTYDQQWDPQWTASGLVLLPGEEANGSPHAIVLGAVDHIVDGANPPQSPAFRHVQQSVWDAHAQDAVWSVAHPDNGEVGADGRPNEYASVLGIDTVEIWNPSSNPDAQIDYAEDRWNRGFRFGVVAASDNHYREYWSLAGPGKPTTWVFAAHRTPGAILSALRAGRTAVSRNVEDAFATIEGDFDHDGVFEAIGGDETIASSASLVQLRVRIRNGIGTTVYVYRSPGRSAGAAALWRPASIDETFLLPVTIEPGHSWFRVEVRAPGELSGLKADPSLPDQLRAATAPIFVSTEAAAVPDPEIALPAPAASADESEPVIEALQGFAGFADVSVADDIPHVVAETHGDGRSRVVYRKLDRAQSGAIVELSGVSKSARYPKVAASGAHVWVVWQQDDRSGSTIYIRHSSDGGLTWERAQKVSDGAGRAVHPSLALVSATCPVVAWADNRSGAFDVHARVLCRDPASSNLSAAGKTISEGDASDARSPRFPASLFPSVAVGRAGKIVVAWQDNRFDPDPLWTGHTPRSGEAPDAGTDPDNWEILASVRDLSQPAWQAPVRVSANEDAADRHPSVAVDGSGAMVIAWDTQPLKRSGVNLSIVSRLSTDEGATWSGAKAIGFEPVAMSQRPKLAVGADGVVRAVWYDSRSSDWRWQVFTSHLDANRTWSPAVQLTTAGNSTWPSVSNGTVVFTSDRRAIRAQRELTHEVFVQTVDAKARPVYRLLPTEPGAGRHARAPALADRALVADAPASREARAPRNRLR
jgi:predicted metal-dependent phosphoesterase TrpH